MQKFKYTTIGHSTHNLCCPIAEERIDEIFSFLTGLQSNRVLDVGCGKGFFLRELSKRIEIIGHGVDLNAEFISEAACSCWAQINAKKLSFQCADINRIPIGADYGAIFCLGSTQSCNGFYKTLALAYNHLCQNGIAVIGDAYKLSENTHPEEKLLPAFLKKCRPHSENIQKSNSLGFKLIYSIDSQQSEWDAYEYKFYKAIFEFHKQNPSDLDAKNMLYKSQKWIRTHEKITKNILGFRTYILKKEGGAKKTTHFLKFST